MPFLVRTFSRAKWNQNNVSSGAPASADAITGCLRTKDNSLSTWEIASTNDLNEAVLAIASNYNKLEAIHVVALDLNKVKLAGLNITSTDGITPYENFAKAHRDISNLDYVTLGVFANVLATHIQPNLQPKLTWHLSRLELINIVRDGVKSGKVDRDRLKPDVQKNIP